jgi:hypothetical protein
MHLSGATTAGAPPGGTFAFAWWRYCRSCLEGAAPPRIVGFHEAQALFARRDRKRPPQPRPRPPFSSVRISPIDAGIRSDLDAALELVRPLPDGLLDVYALSTEINSSRVEGIELLTPLHG